MRYGAAVLCICVSVLSQAEIYQWRDEHGRLQFSDSPPAASDSAQEVQQRKLEPLEEIGTVKPRATHSTNWRAQEQSAYKRKKRNRLKQERNERAKERKRQRCKQARSRYRSFQARRYGATDMNSIRQKRATRDRLKRRMKDACY